MHTTFISLIILISMSTQIFGDATSDGIQYKQNSTGGATILGYKGKATELIIPAKIGKLAVTEIGPSAFENMKFSSINLPEGLQIVGEYAFKKNYQVVKMNLPDSIISIGDEAFKECLNWDYELKIPSKLKFLGIMAFFGSQKLRGDLVFPDTLTIIPDMAFALCYNIHGKLVLGSKVKYIGRSAFSNTDFKGELFLPESLLKIGDMAFYHCSQFTGQLTLPKNLIRLGDSAFAETLFSGSVTLPESLIYIGDRAFASSGKLEIAKTIPANLQYLGIDAFKKTKNEAKELTAGFKKPGFLDDEELLDLPKSADQKLTYTLNKAGTYTVSAYTGKAPIIVIPAVYKNVAVTEIGSRAFVDNNYLINIILPESIKVIGPSAFEYCHIISKYLKLPNSIERIEDSAFRYASLRMNNIVLPNSLKFIGKAAFYVTAIYGSLVIPPNVTIIDEDSFGGCRFLNGTLSLPVGLKSIGKLAFQGTGFTGDLILPEGLIQLDEGAFVGSGPWKGILKLPASLELIPPRCFQNLQGLTSVNLPEGLKEIGESAFAGISSLTIDPKFPSTLTKIGTRAFAEVKNKAQLTKFDNGWDKELGDNRDINGVLVGPILQNKATILGVNSKTKLQTIQLPSTFEIGNPSSIEILPNAFKGDGRILSVYFSLENLTIGDSAFADCKNLGNIVRIDQNVKSIGKSAFARSPKIQAFIVLSPIPPLLGDIEAFDENIPIIIPESYLDNYLKAPVWKNLSNRINKFMLIEDLTKLTFVKSGEGMVLSKAKQGNFFPKIPDLVNGLPVTEIGDNAFFFDLANQIFKIAFPSSIRKIGNDAFNGANLVGELSLPEGLTEIGRNVFQNTKYLSKLTLPSTLKNIPQGAFQYSTLRQIIFPKTMETIDIMAFDGNQLEGDLKLPDHLDLLERNSFDTYTRKLTGTLTLPKNRATLRGAIGGLSYQPFKKVICQSPIPYKVENFDRWQNDKTIFYVPSQEALNAYKADPDWSKIKNYQIGTGL